MRYYALFALAAAFFGSAQNRDSYPKLSDLLSRAGEGSTITLPCGSYVTGALKMNKPNVTLQGARHGCVTVTFSGLVESGLTITANGIRIKNLSFSGKVSRTIYVDQVNNITIDHNTIEDGGSVAGAKFPLAGIWIQGGRNIWIMDNTLTSDGPSSGNPSGYDIVVNPLALVPPYTASAVHIRGNMVFRSNVQNSINLFNCNSCDAQFNIIDQNNRYNGDGSGHGYGIIAYSTNGTRISSLSRRGNVVTASLSRNPEYPFLIGSHIAVTSAVKGLHGTNFDGDFYVISASDRRLVWRQNAMNDDAVTAAVNQASSRFIAIGNQVTNTAGSCIYLQSMTDSIVAQNNLSDCARQTPDFDIPQAGVAVIGERNRVAGNVINRSGHAGVSWAGLKNIVSDNTISQTAGIGIYPRDASSSVVTNNKISQANIAAVGSISTGQSCSGCRFFRNTIELRPGADGYVFNGPEDSISITGGQIKAPPIGMSQHGIVFSNMGAKNILVGGGLDIDCFAAGTTVPTLQIGIHLFGSDDKIEGVIISGCKLDGNSYAIGLFGTNSSAANNIIKDSYRGILDRGVSDSIRGNVITGSVTGIAATGQPRIQMNNFSGNRTNIDLGKDSPAATESH